MAGVGYVADALGSTIQDAIANDINIGQINCVGLFMYLFSCLLRQWLSYIIG